MGILIPLLVAQSGLSESVVRRIVNSAPKRYKKYYISKRNGGRREISQPAKELKILQRILVSHVLSDLPLHECAMAYRKGKSIKDNAYVHKENGALKKYDFSDFFLSIKETDWRKFCFDRGIFRDAEDLWVSTQVLFHRAEGRPYLRLAIGAPSSPHISNLIMYNFDRKIKEVMARDKVTYTRYADDLTFSAKRTGNLLLVDQALKRVMRTVSYPRLKLNSDKTVTATKKTRRVVTGLVLSNEGAISIGHEQKKKIRAAVHHASQELLDKTQLKSLSGMLSYIKSVEPDFIDRLAAKYGHELVLRICSV